VPYPDALQDTWASGDAYEQYVGRWSRQVAAAFVRWLDPPPGQRWLDVGCGTGALSAVVLALADPAAVTGIDTSEGFVAHARAQVSDPRARFDVGDAMVLPTADGSVDAVVSGLALNFVPDPGRAVAEFARVSAAGGTVAAYVWDYAEGMGMMRRFWDAAAALDPAAAKLDEGRRFPVCQPEALSRLWTDAGVRAVVTEAIEVPTVFADFDDYWGPFLLGQAPAPGYVASLSEPRRAALREHLRGSLPAQPDGSIALTARAWAVRGRAASA
jgi:SAM-dependent methyltransferase